MEGGIKEAEVIGAAGALYRSCSDASSEEICSDSDGPAARSDDIHDQCMLNVLELDEMCHCCFRNSLTSFPRVNEGN